jgi:LacI family transcriptional regulator
MAQGRVTIADVAAHAGVSVSTVSKVINDRYGVAENTFARVRHVIDELGYHASLAGQSLRSRRTNVIGVLVRDLEPFSAELLKGVGEGIHGTGYELVVFSGCGQPRDQAGWERRYLARISGTLADGVILVTPGSVDAAAGSPVVAVDHNVRSSALPTVDSENFLGAASAVEHLLALGHRRIGFVGGRPDLESARLREAAYRRALEEAGIPFDPALVREGGFQPEAAREATNALLALEHRPTAIFAANDVMALAAMSTAKARGLAIPEDLSVVGFDNVPESALATPPLTTVEQPIRQMGVEAVRILMEWFDNPARTPDRVVLPTRLVVRQSSRPLASRA